MVSCPTRDSLVIKEKRSWGLRPILFGPCIRISCTGHPSCFLSPIFALAQEEIEVAALVGLQYGILK
jgi:hypothetical protein